MTSGWNRALLTGAVVAMASMGCGGDDASEELSADELIKGQAAGAEFAAVGALDIEKGAAVCTATLIAPRFIITAQHCLEGGSLEEPIDLAKKPGLTTFLLGQNMKKPDKRVVLKQWFKAPAVPMPEAREFAWSSDVAIGELSADVAGVTPIPVSGVALKEADAGTPMEVLGFGVGRVDGDGAATGRREVGKMNLAVVSGNAFEKRFKTKAAFLTFYATLDPAGVKEGAGDRAWANGELLQDYEVLARDPNREVETCFGDSGGPLIRTRNGKREIVAVVSRGFPGITSSCVRLGTVFAAFGPKTAAFIASKVPLVK